MLAHYDLDKPLVISCDASLYGIGAVLAQENSWRREVSIAFASWTPGPTKQNYTLLDRGRLAVVFVAQHFHKFIVGCKVTFYTSRSWEAGSPSSVMARWRVRLSMYSYDLKFRLNETCHKADALSRLPLPKKIEELSCPGDVLLFNSFLSPLLTVSTIAQVTRKTQSSHSCTPFYMPAQLRFPAAPTTSGYTSSVRPSSVSLASASLGKAVLSFPSPFVHRT